MLAMLEDIPSTFIRRYFMPGSSDAIFNAFMAFRRLTFGTSWLCRGRLKLSLSLSVSWNLDMSISSTPSFGSAGACCADIVWKEAAIDPKTMKKRKTFIMPHTKRPSKTASTHLIKSFIFITLVV